ncbi:peptidase [Erysipelothrix piscisicarius]|uniref:Peptidase n=1 Tax=Erysipelothrix piscisicarius TaxID=2485784 RepID=A0A3S8RL83_9FIRM|nr:membrane dipeptidase [Erysipelothrix piscisicarius]AZK43609.1 peptidase [Erysipelothrix piscisicarius]
MTKKYKIIDLHCDVLLKLQQDQSLNFKDSNELDVNYEKLKASNTKVQAMAIFIDPDLNFNDKYQIALEQIDVYKHRVLTIPHVVQIRSFSDIEKLGSDEIGTFLTLEGLDCVGNDMEKVKHLLDEGVLSIGMTWNDANLACDGIGEPRGAGLTAFGFNVVEELNERNLFVDVSHISLKGFDDVLNSAKHVIASHSNVKAIASHRRNLNDNQIRRMLEGGFPIHVVYYDAFVTDDEKETEISDLVRHIEYLVEMGCEQQIGLGSDFDGIATKIKYLADASKTQNLLLEIENTLGEKFTNAIAYDNFINYVNYKMI